MTKVDEEDLLLAEEIEEQLLPTRTYGIKNGRIQDHIDGLDAVAQAVDKILSTERFEHEIYSEDYGAEMDRLIGQDFDFVESDIERTITDALSVDDRIESIENFIFEKAGTDSAFVKFTVVAIEGSIVIEREVAL